MVTKTTLNDVALSPEYVNQITNFIVMLQCCLYDLFLFLASDPQKKPPKNLVIQH